MEFIEDFVLCDGCQNKDFKLIYNFRMRFHGVNFSDDLIYDKLTDELYQCTQCKKTFTLDQLNEMLDKIKKRHKGENQKIMHY